MKSQATRANLAQVMQHIQRQRDLGELMIGGHDRVKPMELVVTAIVVVCVLVANARGWL